MFHHPVWPKKSKCLLHGVSKCGDRKEVCVTNVDLPAKAGPWFSGPDIINSDLHTRFFLYNFVPNIVLGLGEMKTMACISGCWESLKYEIYVGFNPSETMQSQGRSVPGPQTFHTHTHLWSEIPSFSSYQGDDPESSLPVFGFLSL